MLSTSAAVIYGALGGLVLQCVEAYDGLVAWRGARRDALRGKPDIDGRIDGYFDVVADGLVGLTRMAIGAVAGYLFRDQVTSALAAVAVGLSAPTLLRQLGNSAALSRAVADGSGDQAQTGAQ